MHYNVNVIFEKDDNGYFVYCPQLTGCHSQGDTFEEARTNIQEAVDLYIETLSREEIAQLLPRELITSTIEIAVA